MDRKEKKSGDPFGGAPMKRLEPTQMPTPPDVSELVKEEVKEEEKPEQDRTHCACGYPIDLCRQFKGDALSIMLYMAGARVITLGEEP